MRWFLRLLWFLDGTGSRLVLDRYFIIQNPAPYSRTEVACGIERIGFGHTTSAPHVVPDDLPELGMTLFWLPESLKNCNRLISLMVIVYHYCRWSLLWGKLLNDFPPNCSLINIIHNRSLVQNTTWNLKQIRKGQA